MYGWIVDGISSLFEPVTGQNPNEWPGKGNVSENIPQLSGLKVGPQRQEGDGRPAKRNYRRLVQEDNLCFLCYFDRSLCNSWSGRLPIRFVISFVKKTVAGVAGLLRLRNPLTNSCKKHRHNEKTQVCSPSHSSSTKKRLLEMVTEKYSKSQPLPFTQTKPQEALSLCLKWKCVFQPTPAPSEPDLSTEVATRLNLVDKAPPAVSPPETHSTHTYWFVACLQEMAAEVSCALGQSDPNVVLSAAFKLRITQRDLTTLQDGGWLNDEVMNFYLSLVMERSSQAGRLKVYAFSTFFFPKLGSGGGGQPGGHAAVKRWTKAVDLFVCDLVLVPLHLGVHWAMAVIDLKSKTVRSYDSMGNRHDDVCDLLLLYLKEEHRVKKGRDLDVTKWTIGSLKASEIPQQKNGSDCGVFACKYADYISKGQPLSFKQCHMPLFRKLMIWEILNQKLL
uniref:Sentrin-specific protease 2-like n=1 Tax=Sphaeramia orbicularis TaxID=375764 RepID=A0A673B641_9TELE